MGTRISRRAIGTACLALACGSGDGETSGRGGGGADDSASLSQAAEAPPFLVPTDGVLRTQAFGTIQGNSSVGADGSFNHEVPLSVPEGVPG